jgi:hypothetical protein
MTDKVWLYEKWEKGKGVTKRWTEDARMTDTIPTPRTDAEIQYTIRFISMHGLDATRFPSGTGLTEQELVRGDFSRQLEKELSVAMAHLHEFREHFSGTEHAYDAALAITQIDKMRRKWEENK